MFISLFQILSLLQPKFLLNVLQTKFYIENVNLIEKNILQNKKSNQFYCKESKVKKASQQNGSIRG